MSKLTLNLDKLTDEQLEEIQTMHHWRAYRAYARLALNARHLRRAGNPHAADYYESAMAWKYQNMPEYQQWRTS